MEEPNRQATLYLKTKVYFGGLLSRIEIPTSDGKPYLVRWIINLPFGRAIYFHKILLSDADRDMHDHPWNFISLIVKGSYVEQTPEGFKLKRWINVKKATDRHRVDLTSPVYTIILRGKRTREWGFHTDKGWVHWKAYNKVKMGSEIV